MLTHVANISANNDIVLGRIIADAYTKVGKDGVVLMEESDDETTHTEVVDGVKFDSGLRSPHLVTDKEKGKAVLESPVVLITETEIDSIRKIQSVLEYAIKSKRPILIIGNVGPQPMSALIMNKAKGNIKVNVVEAPGFSTLTRDMLDDLAAITGARVISEDLGDDLDLIDESFLGEAVKAVTDDKDTVITTTGINEATKDRIETIEKQIKEEKNPYLLKKLNDRKAMLSGAVGIIYVGANSKVELKEKKDRVEDAIYAVKAALKEGIVPGAGVALVNASSSISPKCPGEKILLDAIKAPFKRILENGGITPPDEIGKGRGIDVVTGKSVRMVSAGIIDPVLVTKTALKNAASVATTIMSADCVISNVRE
jgi:chaperonin GroEL